MENNEEIIQKVFAQKAFNATNLQRVYKRDMPSLSAINRKLSEKWNRKASFADAISFLLEFYTENR